MTEGFPAGTTVRLKSTGRKYLVSKTHPNIRTGWTVVRGFGYRRHKLEFVPTPVQWEINGQYYTTSIKATFLHGIALHKKHLNGYLDSYEVELYKRRGVWYLRIGCETHKLAEWTGTFHYELAEKHLLLIERTPLASLTTALANKCRRIVKELENDLGRKKSRKNKKLRRKR